MGASLCRLCASSIFGVRAVFGMDASHIFSQCSVHYPLDRGLVLCFPEPALDIEQGLLFAPWLSQPCWREVLFPSC